MLLVGALKNREIISLILSNYLILSSLKLNSNNNIPIKEYFNFLNFEFERR
jgi:hypothetical protein